MKYFDIQQDYKKLLNITITNIIIIILLTNLKIPYILLTYIPFIYSLYITSKLASKICIRFYYNYLINYFNNSSKNYYYNLYEKINYQQIEKNIFTSLYLLLYTPIHLIILILVSFNFNILLILIIYIFILISLYYNNNKLILKQENYIATKDDFIKSYKIILLANKVNKEEQKINLLEKSYRSCFNKALLIKTFFIIIFLTILITDYNQYYLLLFPIIILMIKFENIINTIKFLKKYPYKKLNKIKNNKLEFKNKITIKKLSYKFLKNINFCIPKNKITIIYGQHLCGKTTLIKLLLKQIPYEEGEILVDKHYLINDSLNNITNYCPQNAFIFSNSLIKNFKEINKNTNQTLINYALKIATAQEFTYDLNKIVFNNGQNLTLEQQNKLKIAFNIINPKELLIFDETFNYIPISNVKRIINNLKKLNKTIIIVTNNPNILQFSEHLLILKNYKIIFEGIYKNIPQNIEKDLI